MNILKARYICNVSDVQCALNTGTGNPIEFSDLYICSNLRLPVMKRITSVCQMLLKKEEVLDEDLNGLVLVRKLSMDSAIVIKGNIICETVRLDYKQAFLQKLVFDRHWLLYRSPSGYKRIHSYCKNDKYGIAQLIDSERIWNWARDCSKSNWSQSKNVNATYDATSQVLNIVRLIITRRVKLD
ncbi:hypothetical protein GJ496_010383 [Pomphorhynchus laevis]|nr:hypothetical protein GJ496_010383 [Pomphorhynchus laevis]